MRDRLIELLTKTFDEQYEKRMLITPQHTADYLLANGVIVPPCKVGDTVYVVGDEVVEELIVSSVNICNCGIEIVVFQKGEKQFGHCFNSNIIGKTVFLSREDAESALRKEMGE